MRRLVVTVIGALILIGASPLLAQQASAGCRERSSMIPAGLSRGVTIVITHESSGMFRQGRQQC